MIEKSICRSFHILAQFSFTLSQRGQNHYQLKVNIRVASQVPERFKTQALTQGKF